MEQKCAIYCRQSSGSIDPDDSLSIELQVEACRKLASDKGLKVVEIYRESDTSGRLYPDGYEALEKADIAFQSWLKTTGFGGKHRTQLGKLLKRLDEVDYILVHDLTRFHRSLSGSFLGQLLMNLLQQSGVKILSVKEGMIDPDRFTDILVTSLTSQISSQQLLLQRQKSMEAQKKLKEAGIWAGSCSSTFGYRSTGRKHEVELDPIRAEIVKKVYELFLDGWKMETISNEVCKLLPEDQSCNRSQVRRILCNIAYTGYCKLDDGQLVKLKPLEGLELVSFSDWKLAQDILKQRADRKHRPKMSWLPLSGVFFCGYCGHKMQSHSRTARDKDSPIGMHYLCRSHQGRNKRSCKNMLTWFNAEAGGVGLCDALMPLMALAVEPSVEEPEELETLQAKAESLRKKQESLVSLFKKDLLTEEDLAQSLTELKTQKAEVDESLKQLRAELADRMSPEQWLTDIEGIDKPQAEIEILLRKAIKKVTIWKDKILVDTCKGSFELPIRRIYHSRLLPQPHQLLAQDDNEQWKEDLVYCFGEDLPKDFEKKMKLLLDADRIKLWIVI